MFTNKLLKYLGIGCICLMYTACNLPSGLSPRAESKTTPANYKNAGPDTINTALVKWKDFFTDPNLLALIDTALQKNQELNIILQEINIANNQVRARKGQYLPFVGVGPAAGVLNVPKYTSEGASDAVNYITPTQKVPQLLPDYMLAATISWQAPIWKQLYNAKNSAVKNYLATTAGKNFMVTHLVAEIANSYYELMALDNQLDILTKNIEVQQNALEIVKMEKTAARTTELAVRRFEAELLKNKSRRYYIVQKIIETENRINFLSGRFPQPIQRNSQTFISLVPDTLHKGIPSQLLQNRPDIIQAEQQLAATKLDVKLTKASFYPVFMITGVLGYEAFNPRYLLTTPQSMLYGLAGGLMAPVVNRNAIKANYYNANSRQIQAVYNYERSILNAYIEVSNQVSNIINLKKSFDFKTNQVQALTQSFDISIVLFKSARADYMEVLLTQRDALEAKFELVETKKQQMNAMVNIYQALGGGWR